MRKIFFIYSLYILYICLCFNCFGQVRQVISPFGHSLINLEGEKISVSSTLGQTVSSLTVLKKNKNKLYLINGFELMGKKPDKESKPLVEVSIFPNPSDNGKINLKFKNVEYDLKYFNVRVYDLNSSLMYDKIFKIISREYSEKYIVDLSILEVDKIYVIAVYDQNNLVIFSQRIVFK